MSETTIPVLPCVDPDATVAFWTALGFTVTYDQRRPYLYLAFERGGAHLHFGNAPKGLDPTQEQSGGALILVDDAEPYHRAFTSGLREAQGRVPAKGVPRITRFRPGQSRFTVVDPNGNSVIVIRRDEEDVEYGGSTKLTGLAKVLDNVRILRDFKTDDVTAAKALDVGLRRHSATATVEDLVRAYRDRIELAEILDQPDVAEECRRRLEDLTR